MGKNISLEWLENSKNYQADTNTSLLLQCHGLASDIDYAVSEVMQNLYGDKGEENKEAKICHETIDKVKESLLDLVKITIDESMASKQNHK